MEKILFLVDQNGIDGPALNFACYLAERTASKLSPIFLDPFLFSLSKSEKALFEAGSGHSSNTLDDDHRFSSLSENRSAFKQSCAAKGVKWLMDTEALLTPADIVRETRFADLLIMGSKARPEMPPSALLREILSRSECPVIVAPAEFEGIDQIVFAYDGSESSMFAIKQFTYLLPQFSDGRVIYLQVNHNDGHEISSQEKLREFLQMHYSSVGYHVLHGKAGDELFAYLSAKKKTMVVIGAYGRSVMSTALRGSAADLLLKTIALPVFVSHH